MAPPFSYIPARRQAYAQPSNAGSEMKAAVPWEDGTAVNPPRPMGGKGTDYLQQPPGGGGDHRVCHRPREEVGPSATHVGLTGPKRVRRNSGRRWSAPRFASGPIGRRSLSQLCGANLARKGTRRSSGGGEDRRFCHRLREEVEPLAIMWGLHPCISKGNGSFAITPVVRRAQLPGSKCGGVREEERHRRVCYRATGRRWQPSQKPYLP